MILRLLGPQGIAGVAISLVLALLLTVQKAETRRWQRESGRYEQLYRAGEAALAGTVANYRAAAERARAADQAAADAVRRHQATINERTKDDLQTRLADARRRSARARAAARRVCKSSLVLSLIVVCCLRTASAAAWSAARARSAAAR